MAIVLDIGSDFGMQPGAGFHIEHYGCDEGGEQTVRVLRGTQRVSPLQVTLAQNG